MTAADAGLRNREPVFATSTAVALTLAVVLLGRALQEDSGRGTPLAVLLLTLAFLCAGLSVAGPRTRFGVIVGEPVVRVIMAAGLAYQFGHFFIEQPGIYTRLHEPWPYGTFYAGLTTAALLAGVCLSGGRRASTAAFAALLVVHFALCCWMVRVSPAPFIDVWVWHGEAFHRLSVGINPYVPPLPNIYGDGRLYGEGAVQGDQVLVGFPYPPLSLLLAGIGHVIGGDYRYAQAAAITLTGGLFAFARPGRIAFGAAALFLFTPRVFIVVEQGFTDPFALCILAAVAFCAIRRPTLLPYLLGMAVATKQYLVFVLPLTTLLFSRPLSKKDWLVWMGKVFASGLATCLPFLLWSPKDFIASVLLFQAHQPFREDSLSYVAWWAKQGGARESRLWLTFAVTLPLAALALRRAPRSITGFLAGSALVLLGFFAFSKQAFCGYYFLILGLLSGAAASCERLVTSAPGALARDDVPSPTDQRGFSLRI
jgi:hypothetical protein